jgi:hypothetical protein
MVFRREVGLTENNRLGLLDGLAESAHWVVHESAVELLSSVEEVHKQWGADRSAETASARTPAACYDECHSTITARREREEILA